MCKPKLNLNSKALPDLWGVIWKQPSASVELANEISASNDFIIYNYLSI
jgi:hypothetical protein